MSQVSKRLPDKLLEQYLLNNLVNTIAKLKDHKEIHNFLDDLLSPIEKTMLIKRLAIAVMLTKGYTYKQIDHTIKVTSPTIKNVSFTLKFGKKNGYNKVVREIISSQNKEAFFDKIEQILLQLSPKKFYGSPAHKRKRTAGRELFIRKLLRDKT